MNDGGLGSRRKTLLGTLPCSLVGFPRLLHFRFISHSVTQQVSTRGGTTCPTMSIPSTYQHPYWVQVDNGRLWKQEKGPPWHPTLFLVEIQGFLFGWNELVTTQQLDAKASIPIAQNLSKGSWPDAWALKSPPLAFLGPITRSRGYFRNLLVTFQKVATTYASTTTQLG